MFGLGNEEGSSTKMFNELKKMNEVSTLEAQMVDANPVDWAVANSVRAIALTISMGMAMGLPLQTLPELLFQVAEMLDGGRQVKE